MNWNTRHLLVSLMLLTVVVSAGCAGLADTPNEAAGNDPTDTPTPTETETNTPTTNNTTTPENNTTTTQTETKTPEPTRTDTPEPTDTPTPTPTPEPTDTKTPTETPEPTTQAQIGENNVTVKAGSGGTSYYRIYAPGKIELGEEADRPGEAEHPDKVVSDVTTYAQGFVGYGGVDNYIMSGVTPGAIVNDGDTTLEIYVNGELEEEVQPGDGVDDYGEIGPSAQTETETTTEVPTTSTETTTPTSTVITTETETETEETTDTPTETVNREEMQVVKVEALEREEVSYEFVASGPVTLGSETTSQAQVSGEKASGAVSNFGTDTFLIPEGEQVIEVRNLNGYEAIRVTVDGEEVGVSGGPDVDKSTFESNSTITIKATGSNRSEYTIYTTGDFFATSETDDSSEAVYPDEIYDESVIGNVGEGGTDSYEFTGKLTSFSNNGDTPLQVSVNGELVATVEPLGFLEEGDLNQPG